VEFLRKLILYLDKLQMGIAAGGLAVIVIIVTVGCFSRYVLNNPFDWVEELSIILFIWIVFMGASVVVNRKRHMRIVFFYQFFPETIKPFIDIFNYIIIISFLVFLIKGNLTLIPFVSSHFSVALGIPKSVYYYPVCISAISMSLTFFVELVDKISKVINVHK